MQAIFSNTAWASFSGAEQLSESTLAALSNALNDTRQALASKAAAVQLGSIYVPLEHLSSKADTVPFAVVFEGHSGAHNALSCKTQSVANFLRQQTRRVSVQPVATGPLLEAALR